MDIAFPLAKEAALCGVYIFSSSTRVGLKSKEALRRDFLRAYEDKYKEGLGERNRRRVLELEKQSKAQTNVTPSVVEEETSASFFMSMVQGLKAVEPVSKPDDFVQEDIFESEDSIWEDDSDDFESCEAESEDISPEKEWSSAGTDLFSVSATAYAPKPVSAVSSEHLDWVSSGTELFSISCSPKTLSKPAPDPIFEEEEFSDWDDEEEDFVEEFSPAPSDDLSSLWEESEECVDWDDEEEELVEESLVSDDSAVDSADDWSRFDEFVEDEEEEIVSPVMEAPKKFSPPPESTAKSFSQRKEPSVKPPIVFPRESSFAPTRLDESSIREFVKSHRLCSESDICRAFSDYESVKVKQCIKSALRKYRIFEKHGRFTV